MYPFGLFWREYRKLASAIPAGFGAGRHREDAERPSERGVRTGNRRLSRFFYDCLDGTCSAGGGRKATGRGCQSGGEGRIRCYRESSMSTWVAPVAPLSPPRFVLPGHLRYSCLGIQMLAKVGEALSSQEAASGYPKASSQCDHFDGG